MEMETSMNGSGGNTGGAGPAGGGGPQMTSAQIKEMMANAQKIIQQRKQALLGAVALPPPGVVIPSAPGPLLASSTPAAALKRPHDTSDPFLSDKKSKLAAIQVQIQSKLAANVLIRRDDAITEPSKPVPLFLDNEGRAVDTSGKQLLFPQHQPTLKANIRAQRKEPRPPPPPQQEQQAEPHANKYFDSRLPPTTSTKQKRAKSALQFNEPGKYIAQAHRQRMQTQLARLQQEIADKARKTGISTAARLARLSGAVSSGKAEPEYIPQVEWWDSLLFEEVRERDILTYDSPLKKDCVTNLIEHPTQLRCPTDPLKPVYVPVFLTKKEMKKLRRQNRRETWKERQEKIRLGLEPADQPKVRISNLMRVLGVEAVQDPTKVEAHVRQQMAKRLKQHKDANLARKLTPEQRREKRLQKIKEDITLGTNVSVYRVDDLSNQAKKFKVEANARQLTMTGCVLLHRECNVVVVEGGPKQQRRYKRLMLGRIKWSEDDCRDRPGVANKCVLVWEGQMKERAFSDLRFKYVQTEVEGREYFRKHGIESFWDLAWSGSVLEGVVDGV